MCGTTPPCRHDRTPADGLTGRVSGRLVAPAAVLVRCSEKNCSGWMSADQYWRFHGSPPASGEGAGIGEGVSCFFFLRTQTLRARWRWRRERTRMQRARVLQQDFLLPQRAPLSAHLPGPAGAQTLPQVVRLLTQRSPGEQQRPYSTQGCPRAPLQRSPEA
jgi:hypothetical protein